MLASLAYLKEQEVVRALMDMLSRGTGLVVFGVGSCMRAVEAGFVRSLLVSEDLAAYRHELVCPAEQRAGETGGIVVRYTATEQVPEQDLGWEVSKTSLLPDWLMGMDLDAAEIDSEEDLRHRLADRLQGAEVQFIAQASPESVQFAKGLGGIAAILRYAVDPALIYGDEEDEDSDEEDEEDEVDEEEEEEEEDGEEDTCRGANEEVDAEAPVLRQNSETKKEPQEDGALAIPAIPPAGALLAQSRASRHARRMTAAAPAFVPSTFAAR
mmetsp:Transcript_4202/g.14819  ORF Transcript_4202/g.14819 Transcript_4202/m.14819 type:complete len:269 (+) Transcript_4202:826-1632(+)